MSGLMQTVPAWDGDSPDIGDTLYVCADEYITLRDYPSTDADDLDYMPTGAAVTFLEYSTNGFYRVKFGALRGYALGSYLDFFEPQSAVGKWMRVVNCYESITLRDLPSTDGDEICQIPLGASVFVLAWPNDDFYKVEYRGYTGYAMRDYIA